MVTQKAQIVVKGLPQPAWAARFDDVQILPLGSDQFILRVDIPDPPALHGLLDRIRTAGLELVSVKCIPFSKEDSHEH